MANYDSSPERRSRSKDKARDKVVEADKAEIKVHQVSMGKAQIRDRVPDKATVADDAAAVVIRINKNVGG